MADLVSSEEFTQRVLSAFPELAEEFEDLHDLPMLRITAFGARLQRAKGAADWDSYEKGIQLVAEVWHVADADLEGRLKWSLMKALDFRGPRGSMAWGYLTPELQHAWTGTPGEDRRSDRPTQEGQEAEEKEAVKPPSWGA